MNAPQTSTELEVEVSHGQLYIYGVEPWVNNPDGYDTVLRALDDARASGRYVGVSEGLVDVLTPTSWNFNTPMRVETWMHEPPVDDGNWDHVVEVDLDVPNGVLTFQGSGGRPPISCDVAPGIYRARVAGRGYDEAEAGVEGMDAYRVQLWPRESDNAPMLRKSWPGWS